MREEGIVQQRVDTLSLVGLALLLAPLLTISHELGGHGLSCLATGGRMLEIGAHYIDCDSPGIAAARMTSVMGAGMDVIVAGLAYLLWRRATGALWRTALWMIVITKLLLATGYPLFSGLTGVGDFGVGEGHSLGALSPALLWRACFVFGGLAAYVAVIVLAIRMLRTMLGGGRSVIPLQRRIPMTLYIVSGMVTLLAAVPNPHGSFILFTSAAASFGGLAGLFNVAFRPPAELPPRPFVIARNWPLIIAGAMSTALFVVILGPSIRLA